jgi:hypothetical protein
MSTDRIKMPRTNEPPAVVRGIGISFPSWLASGTSEAIFDEKFLEVLGDCIGAVLMKWLGPKLEAAQKPWPRWMSIETAGKYIDKTYLGMRYTLEQFPEIHVAMIGDCKRLHRLGGGGQVRDGEWAGRPPMQPRGERNRREAAGYGD